MRKIIPLVLLACLLIACQTTTKKQTNTTVPKAQLSIEFATGFDIQYFEGYKEITLTNAWPGTDKKFKYALLEKGTTLSNPEEYDAIVQLPISKMVVTSTTHIPSLEMLGVEETLIGFPNLDYISSEKTRNRIDQGLISELGKNESINTEVLIDLNPDAVIGFAVSGTNKSFNTIQKKGIPVLYNSDWTEHKPLGKAEWIKFFAAFYNKEKLADSLFTSIKEEYFRAKELAKTAQQKPTVLSGAMYKDIWYVPQGKSWAAQFIEDANGTYLWRDTDGTGSMSLNIETVLEKAREADFWIGPSHYTSLEQLNEAHPAYSHFDAFTNKKVYSFTSKKGETGGLIYFELAPNRPDLVLKDIIKMFHPELLPNYDFYFFSQLP